MELYRFPPQFVSQVWSHYRVIMIADINALDTTDYDGKKYYKTWEDVLDVIVKLRLPSGVTVLDMGTLRRQYLERNTGTTRNVCFLI